MEGEKKNMTLRSVVCVEERGREGRRKEEEWRGIREGME